MYGLSEAVFRLAVFTDQSQVMQMRFGLPVPRTSPKRTAAEGIDSVLLVREDVIKNLRKEKGFHQNAVRP